jgi:hypothetical protein
MAPATVDQGMTVKRYAFAVTLSLLMSSAAQGAAIDLDNDHVYRMHGNDVMVPPPASMSELPEPEVCAMMLVGLILIGYRASRDSNEKFK